jgi:hypothetical protein
LFPYGCSEFASTDVGIKALKTMTTTTNKRMVASFLGEFANIVPPILRLQPGITAPDCCSVVFSWLRFSGFPPSERSCQTDKLDNFIFAREYTRRDNNRQVAKGYTFIHFLKQEQSSACYKKESNWHWQKFLDYSVISN